jgi:hypothetical protein
LAEHFEKGAILELAEHRRVLSRAEAPCWPWGR